MIFHKICLFFLYVIINATLVHGLLAETQSEKAARAVNKIVENIKENVPEDNLVLYEKFSRKTINSLYLESSSEDEINFLINALTFTFIAINEKNKYVANKINKIQIIKNDLANEKEKILKQTLKESYQLWLKKSATLKSNILLIKKKFNSNY